ncbi:DUF2642 domain-containing protein [Hazenella sp. IB182357]|uniref:DUF2642 domain-containing protein n=1 Tax=Polycladospora coralii TaxID=2771432 RepID=A0A926N8A1_9BACL|nr:DUF2642 domain-containing protein [Polycladospora coralii]MBD1371453.1 DUF2642 domain-containing protein [Polycladospora coralii]MBS7530421.1 DUF2642 domain-containing protein [Polycladospora coralii]
MEKKQPKYPMPAPPPPPPMEMPRMEPPMMPPMQMPHIEVMIPPYMHVQQEEPYFTHSLYDWIGKCIKVSVGGCGDISGYLVNVCPDHITVKDHCATHQIRLQSICAICFEK